MPVPAQVPPLVVQAPAVVASGTAITARPVPT
jgi:hypothetical protein